MILNDYAKILKTHEKDIAEGKTTLEFLMEWIKNILSKKPKTNVEKIIHSEIELFKNDCGDYFLVAKTESGQVLTNALYEFSKSFERHVMRKWLQDKKPIDFKIDKK